MMISASPLIPRIGDLEFAHEKGEGDGKMATICRASKKRIERLADFASGGSVELYLYILDQATRRLEAPALSLPAKNETAAVAAPNHQKLAALFFDRVGAYYRDIEHPIPFDIAIEGGTQFELWVDIVCEALSCSQGFPRDLDKDLKALQIIIGDEPTDMERKVAKLDGNRESEERYLCNAFYVTHGFRATPIYASGETRDRQFQPGRSELVIAAIQNIGLADDSKLTWEQVLEFRKDEDAKVKLRRLRNWLDRDMPGKPISFVSDTIATRLDDYERAVKKHGIKTVTGTMSQLLDWKLLTSIGATAGGLLATGHEFLAALAGAGILIGNAAVSITDKLVDARDVERGANAEVAFVHEIKKMEKKS